MQAVLATRNKGKTREIGRILEDADIQIVPLDDFPGVELPPETGATFSENALIKARAVAAATGLPALADDSGLEVDCLGGAPGVRSARYAGEKATDRQNYEKLLAALEGRPREERTARFRCALAFIDGNGVESVFEGSFEGEIAAAPRGANGFGYDPVFFIPELGRTAAELSAEEKNTISHRAKALELFKKTMMEKHWKKS